jgi:hypothetical protein
LHPPPSLGAACPHPGPTTSPYPHTGCFSSTHFPHRLPSEPPPYREDQATELPTRLNRPPRLAWPTSPPHTATHGRSPLPRVGLAASPQPRPPPAKTPAASTFSAAPPSSIRVLAAVRRPSRAAEPSKPGQIGATSSSRRGDPGSTSTHLVRDPSWEDRASLQAQDFFILSETPSGGSPVACSAPSQAHPLQMLTNFATGGGRVCYPC